MPTMTRTAWGLDTRDDDVHQWRLYAACRGYDPSWWDLVGAARTDSNRKALQICATCPVRRQCYDMGVRTQSWGVILGGVDFHNRGGVSPLSPPFLAVCDGCGIAFTTTNPRRKWCSQTCRVTTGRASVGVGGVA